jgi:hypothetical protein
LDAALARLAAKDAAVSFSRIARSVDSFCSVQRPALGVRERPQVFDESRQHSRLLQHRGKLPSSRG